MEKYVKPASYLTLLISLLLVGTMSYSYADTLHEGQWTKKKYKIKGEWQIVSEEGQHYIVLSDSFKTKNAPDLKLFLSKQSVDSANGKNATSDAVLISELTSNKGSQRYLIPQNIDLANYNTLLLHCEQYSVLWGGATLK